MWVVERGLVQHKHRPVDCLESISRIRTASGITEYRRDLEPGARTATHHETFNNGKNLSHAVFSGNAVVSACFRLFVKWTRPVRQCDRANSLNGRDTHKARPAVARTFERVQVVC